MTLDERFAYLLVGLAVGFVVGYITRALHQIEKEVQEVDRIVRQQNDEEGAIRLPSRENAALLIVVVLTAIAAFLSQRASSDVAQQTKQQQVVVDCTSEYLASTIEALNERTEYSSDQASANVELQKAQSAFIRLALQEPPLERTRVEEGLRDYFTKLTAYVDLVEKTRMKQQEFPYPAEDSFELCVEQSKGDLDE